MACRLHNRCSIHARAEALLVFTPVRSRPRSPNTLHEPIRRICMHERDNLLVEHAWRRTRPPTARERSGSSCLSGNMVSRCKTGYAHDAPPRVSVGLRDDERLIHERWRCYASDAYRVCRGRVACRHEERAIADNISARWSVRRQERCCRPPMKSSCRPRQHCPVNTRVATHER